MPAEVVIMKTPKRMRRRAIVPPRPIARDRKVLINPPFSMSVEIQPRAVLTPGLPLMVHSWEEEAGDGP